MRNLIFFIFISVTIIALPSVFADTSSNSDFDPFPQMEQDLKNTDDQAVSAPQQQNDDWPPAKEDAQPNSGGDHE
jgi:hypothetical protein